MSRPSIQPFTPLPIEKPWGLQLIIGKTADYMGSCLFYEKGKSGDLQAHRRKVETFFLMSGDAVVHYDDGTGALVEHRMVPNESFHIPAGAPHKFTALEDCIVFEVSTPVENDRVRLEEAYGMESNLKGLPTTEPE